MQSVAIRTLTPSFSVRLDGYTPPVDGVGGEIVSRKYTNLSGIQPETARRYIDEIVEKYLPTRIIADVPSTRAMDLANKSLGGKMILEIPKQPNGIPADIASYAGQKDVVIREVVDYPYVKP